MTTNCKFCKKSRIYALYIFVILLPLNALLRQYLELPLENIMDVVFLPSLLTLCYGMLAFLLKNIKHG